jgi:hypothetical protein
MKKSLSVYVFSETALGKIGPAGQYERWLFI